MGDKNRVLIAAGVLGGVYLLFQRGNVDAAGPALALPGSNLMAPAVTAPTGLLQPLTIRIEAPTVTLPAAPAITPAIAELTSTVRRVLDRVLEIEAPTVTLPAAPAITPAIAELTKTVRHLVDRVIEPRDLPAVGELVPGLPGLGGVIEDLTGKIEDLTADNAGLLDRVTEAFEGAAAAAAEAAELVRLDAIKSALADWTSGQAVRDAAEAAWEKAREIARVDTILDSYYAARDQATGTVLDLAPGLGDLGMVGEAVGMVGDAIESGIAVTNFVDSVGYWTSTRPILDLAADVGDWFGDRAADWRELLGLGDA